MDAGWGLVQPSVIFGKSRSTTSSTTQRPRDLCRKQSLNHPPSYRLSFTTNVLWHMHTQNATLSINDRTTWALFNVRSYIWLVWWWTPHPRYRPRRHHTALLQNIISCSAPYNFQLTHDWLKNESILSLRVTSVSIRLSSSRSCNENTELAGGVRYSPHHKSIARHRGSICVGVIYRSVGHYSAYSYVRCIDITVKTWWGLFFGLNVYMVVRLLSRRTKDPYTEVY